MNCAANPGALFPEPTPIATPKAAVTMKIKMKTAIEASTMIRLMPFVRSHASLSTAPIRKSYSPAQASCKRAARPVDPVIAVSLSPEFVISTPSLDAVRISDRSTQVHVAYDCSRDFFD